MISIPYILFGLDVLTLKAQFGFSVTSWWRTVKRNQEVGGVPNSKHLSGLAIDLVLDNPSDNQAFIQAAQGLGLFVLDEGDHIHINQV